LKKEKKEDEGFVVAFVDRIPMGIFSMVLENLVEIVCEILFFYEQS
jgi:hypothetical protein